MPSRPLLALFAALILALPGGFARADDEPTAVPEAVRKASIKRIGRDLARKARSARAVHYKEVILGLLESLGTLGGWEAGVAALKAVPVEDEEVRDGIFALVETYSDPELLRPLVAVLEEKDYRRDYDLKRRLCKALSVVADPEAVLPLSELIRTDEEPTVVAASADALATFPGAPLASRKEAVKRLVDTYTSTWNLMMSIRAEDRILRAKMKERYRIYGGALRAALRALTGAQLSRPQEWREWWNENKKRNDW